MIVYIDETGINEYLYRLYCRSKRGKKVYIEVQGRRYARTNIVAGLLNGKVISTMEYGGNTDHIVFETWFVKMLLPALPSGSTIIMDNATFHRKKVLVELAKANNCNILFLPHYSPDYNPIENVWANLKNKIK